jgi:hypothetical protein
MRGLPVVLVCLALAVASWPARSASAAELEDTHTLHVLFVGSPNALEAARALTQALKRAVRSSGRYELGRGEHSLEVLAATLGCDDRPDPTCQRRIAHKLDARAYVWGVLLREGSELVAELHLWQDGGERGRTALRYSAELGDADDDSLRRLASGALAELMGVSAASVTLMAGTANGVVLVDGEPAGTLSNGLGEIDVPGGEHWLTLRPHGYAEAKLRIVVVPGKRYELLVPLERRSSAVRRASTTEPRNTAGYVALGAGAVLLAGGLYSSLSSDSDAIGVALMGAGALAIGTGVFFLLTPPATTPSGRPRIAAGMGIRF